MSNAEQKISIQRFIEAQNSPYAGYEQALKEITAGRKRSHWIWYIFPQMAGLDSVPNPSIMASRTKKKPKNTSIPPCYTTGFLKSQKPCSLMQECRLPLFLAVLMQ